MEEFFDVVDRDDRVIGRAARAAVHRGGLTHRAVHLFVFNERGEVFLQKRSLFKDIDPGKWSTSCAGHVDSGENYDTAVMREAGEELGLHLSGLPEKLRYVSASPETGNEFLWIYRLTAEGPFALPPAEIEEGAWWTVADLEERMAAEPEGFSGTFRFVWKLARSERLF